LAGCEFSFFFAVVVISIRTLHGIAIKLVAELIASTSAVKIPAKSPLKRNVIMQGPMLRIASLHACGAVPIQNADIAVDHFPQVILPPTLPLRDSESAPIAPNTIKKGWRKCIHSPYRNTTYERFT
jgi:hypothetical protein